LEAIAYEVKDQAQLIVDILNEPTISDDKEKLDIATEILRDVLVRGIELCDAAKVKLD